jgi:cytochrome b6-f complex iron-sulfur subunit
MRSTVWVVDPKEGVARADAIAASLAAHGVAARVHEFPSGPAVVIDDPPAGLAPHAGVVRTATADVPAASAMTRRALLDVFAGALVVTTAAAATGVVTLFASPPPRRSEDESEIEAASLADLKAKGAVRFRFGREPCILVHSGERVYALSLVCTHLGCLVEWSAERHQLVCPCHKASFGLAGNVIEGPPKRPLPTFDVTVVGDRVLVKRRTEA